MPNVPLLRTVLATFAFASALYNFASAQTSTGPAVATLTLIDAAAQRDLRVLDASSTIVLSVDGKALNVRAEVSGSAGCVAFYLNGSHIRTENLAPYAFAADDSGVYRKWTPPLGKSTLRAVAYSGANRSGTAGVAKEVVLEVLADAPVAPAPITEEPVVAPAPTPTPTGLAVTTLMLINTTTQQELHPLQADDPIVLSTCGSALNVRADVSGKVGSVAFYLDGKFVRCENVAPYALAADDSGRFYAWTPALGTHTLRAVPYPKANRSGTPGATLEVSFEVCQTPKVVFEPFKMYGSNGALNLSAYEAFAQSYDELTMEKRLGPAFADLHVNTPEDRPTLYRPPSYSRVSGYPRTNPYELGTNPTTDGDYWSDSGQVGYIPDDPVNDPGLDRIQTYAYYDKVFAISPRLDWASGRPHPEPQTRDSYYQTLFGTNPMQPVAMVRSYGMQQNEALVLYRGGLLGVAGMQTSRGSNERPYPGLKFPAHKVPTAIAITTACEFALVTIWDTELKKGQLAVIALEGKYLPFHTWPYMGLANQGSWSAFKLLGYVDLPMTTPTAVAAASNAWWSGPSQTGGLVLSQIDLSYDKHRLNVYSGAWTAVVAKSGYALVASQHDNKVAMVDLTPLLSYMRESYLSSAESFKRTMAARGTGDANFPEAFTVKPQITPKVVWTETVAEPTAVLAGLKLDRWTKDYFKAYVASRDGTISIIDTSSLMKRSSWERLGALRITGTFNVGANPVDMCLARRSDSNLPLIPYVDGKQVTDTRNNLLYIAVRGERKVVAAVTFEGKGAIYRTIRDVRMGDPVAVSTAIRGPIVSVADFRGKKILSFRVGRINDTRNDKIYGCGADGTDPFELAGELPFAGHPFLVNSANTN
ncbi:hypothetical protein [Opitutus terrae]|uniref:Bacterial Ig-like domain-containing protein n=1 Tax=Opitutus terrae (strain DSM 11246 / JCM 15787 / PB90-1) TaxID=452637 RepID=B1ZY03_OPITP|nr:hypothetical protein [Opitutus terrae]ACB75202.1 hypothetical protein Oter_1919 [Opitutus terrae PB90-1]